MLLLRLLVLLLLLLLLLLTWHECERGLWLRRDLYDLLWICRRLSSRCHWTGNSLEAFMVSRVLRLLLGLVSVVYLVERLGLWSWRLGQNILRWLLHVATWCWVNTKALLRMWV